MALRLWPRSLIARILLVELGAILIVSIALPAVMVWLLDQQTNRYQVKTLTEQAREIGRGIRVDGSGLTVTLKPDLAQAYTTRYDGRAYAIVDANGEAIRRSAHADLLPWRDAPRASKPRWFRTGALVGVSEPFVVGGVPLWVIAAQDETGRGAIIDDVVHAFVTRYAPLLFLILLLLPLLNSLLIRRLVVEVRTVSARAQEIGPQTLDARLDEDGLPLEVAPLVHATNGLLIRLEQSFRQQSEFVANVAHELRTPLATLRFEIEQIDSDPLREQIDATAERLGRVISQLQALAALEITARSFTRFDAVALAREVVGELAPRILDQGDRIALEAPPHAIEVQANRTLIALALSNLVTNATRHTPSGTSIVARVLESGGFEVIDDGPGIAAADPAQSRQRYWRADNQRSDGAGLGLSIVSRIMEVHGGTLTVENRPEGGTRVALILPAMPTADPANRAA